SSAPASCRSASACRPRLLAFRKFWPAPAPAPAPEPGCVRTGLGRGLGLGLGSEKPPGLDGLSVRPLCYDGGGGAARAGGEGRGGQGAGGREGGADGQGGGEAIAELARRGVAAGAREDGDPQRQAEASAELADGRERA